ncbi:MAG: EAL domain-containing protein [Pseudomonadota bacterium]|nr:EAL domain-containing protein [Pseudomonadota bacterium]
MSKILIIPLFIIALFSGPVFEILMGKTPSALSFVISVASISLVLTISFFLQLRKINKKSHQNYIDLKNTKESVLKIEDQLTELQKRIDTLPQAENVASELRILRGLMKQVTEKVSETQTTKNIAKEMESDDEEVNQDASTKAGPREPFLNYDDAEILIFLDRAVKEDRVQLFIQPTVRLPQRIPAFYECFSRITDNEGNIIRPEQYLPVSDSAGLTAALDNLLLFRCIQLVRETRREQPDILFFCNISNKTLTDIEFFTDFIDFMANNTQLASSLVFEFSQQTIEDSTFEIQTNLKRLAGLGFRLAVDQLKDLNFDLSTLSSKGFKFIKIDAHLLHEVAKGEDALINMNSLKGAMDRQAMDLIVEKIETEEMLVELLDLRIDFGQGYLFGEPKAVKK